MKNQDLNSDFLTSIFSDIQTMIDNGSSVSQAISVVCDKNGLNSQKIYNQYFKNEQNDKENTNELSVGSFVYLNGDSSQKHYEVININDKDAILLRDTDDNSEFTASEQEITPIIMESEMNKLNEAQYNISINGLETEDAATLSQMLSLADQAENTSMMSDPMQADMAMPGQDVAVEIEPMPMDAMDEPVEDDITFDEELPADTEIAFDEELPSEEPSMDEMTDSVMDEDVILDKSQEDPTLVAQEDGDLDEALLNAIQEALDIAGVESLEEVEEVIPSDEELEEGIKDYLPRAGFIRDDDEDKSSHKMGAFVGQGTDDQLRKAKIIAKVKFANGDRMGKVSKEDLEHFDEYYEEYKSIYGEPLDEELDLDTNLQDAYAEELVGEAYNGNFESVKEDVLNGTMSTEAAVSALLDMGEADSEEEALEIVNGFGTDGIDEFMSDYFYDNAELQSEFDYDLLDEYKKQIFEKWQDLVHNEGENEWVAAEMAAKEVLPNSTDKDTAKRFDAQGNWEDEVAEALRIAGIQLDEVNEECHRKGEIVTDETLFANENEQEPEYKEVSTTDFGKEASEGNKKPLTLESTVKMDKIKSIYETAKAMYAKKDASEWLRLDRRYVEKLIKEGVGYTKASQMLMNAKKGK